MDAQAIIAEAFNEAPAQEAAIEVAATEATPEPETPVIEESAESIATKPDSELTPEQLAKREANRISHQNSKEARLRRENRELKALIESSQKAQPPKEISPPKLEDYDSLDQWVLATAEHLNTKSQQTQEASKPSTAHLDLHRAETISKIQNFASTNREYAALEQENLETLQTIPEDIQQAFFRADNAQLALYALMKEGALGDIYDVPTEKLSYFIGKAEERGKSYLGSVKKATNTPPPIESLKGTGRTTKDLDSMSVEELMKKFNR
jgi:hypothetical protein